VKGIIDPPTKVAPKTAPVSENLFKYNISEVLSRQHICFHYYIMTAQNSRQCIATFSESQFHSAQQHNHRLPWGPLKLNTAVTSSSLIPIPSKVGAARIYTASLRLILCIVQSRPSCIFLFSAIAPIGPRPPHSRSF